MTTTLDRPARTDVVRVGTVLALTSAATFGSSGPMGKALIDAGWTAGSAVLVRLAGAAVVLCLAAAVTLRGRLRLRAASLRTLVVYGAVAMAGAQLAFFNAVRTLDVGVALLLEFLAPVLLLALTSVRRRALPAPATLAGAAATLVGLVLVLEPNGSAGVDPVGVLWGLLAAVCLAAFFVLSERQHDDLPPLVLAAGGTAVGAVVIALAGAVGLVPLAFSTEVTALAGREVSWLLPAAWLVLVSTVAAYLAGIGSVVRLGVRPASFLALTEVLFAVLIAWALLGQLPGLSQLAGGAAIVGGILVIRRHERPVPPEPLPA